MLFVVVHALLAQLTLVLAVAFTLITRASRWRLWWLSAPAAAGLAWTLVAGPGLAAAGFTAGPAHILSYLGDGSLLARPGRLPGALAGAGNWLPRQLPLALLSGAAEAAVAGWLGWLRAGGRASPPPRPGVLAALRRSAAARLISSGAVLTRDGCALGVVAATGGVAELRWADIADGAVVAGAAARQVTVTSLQVVHAALRRRKPLIVIDAGGGVAITAALTAACAATGVPLRQAGAADTGLDQLVADLGGAVIERSALLLTAGSPGDVDIAAAAITALAANLRRIGVDGDGVIWVPGAETIPTAALAALIRDGGAAGLPALIGTVSPSAAAELAGLASAVLVHRVADPDLAASLAARAGTPAPGGTPAEPSPGTGTGHPQVSPVPARALLCLGPADFMLSVTGRGRGHVRFGRVIPARLPRVPGEAGEVT